MLTVAMLAAVASSCKKETRAEVKEETPERLVLSFTHDRKECTLPVITRYDGTLFTGRVDWGDDTGLEPYQEESIHLYAKKCPFEVGVYGKDPDNIEFGEIYGITSSDFSVFK